MKDYEKENKSKSIWSTIIDVVQCILSIGLLIGLIAPILNGRYDDWIFLILLGVFYWIVKIIGEGVLSLFD